MTENYIPTTYRLLRHGQSVSNAGNLFAGGAPDADRHGPDRKRGANKLTNLGSRQACAASMAAAMLSDVTVNCVSTSQMNRAIHTGVLFAQGYGPDAHVSADRLPGFHEVRHGRLEWTPKPEATARRKANAARMADLHVSNGLHPDLKDLVSWVVPNGEWDDECYLQAALRGLFAIESHIHQPNEVLVGHQVLMRQIRALAMYMPGHEREELRQLYAQQLQAQHGEVTNTSVLTPVVEALYAYGVPALSSISDKSKAIANAEMVEVQVNDNGLWTPTRRIKPAFPEDIRIPLTPDNVCPIVQPFTTADAWV